MIIGVQFTKTKFIFYYEKNIKKINRRGNNKIEFLNRISNCEGVTIFHLFKKRKINLSKLSNSAPS